MSDKLIERRSKRHETREKIFATPEHARWIELLDSIPNELRWGMRFEVEARGKYKNYLIDRRNGWASVSREDILWLEAFIAEMCLPIVAPTRELNETEINSARAELHETVEARQQAIDAFCELCIGKTPSNINARCPDATCPLRAFCKAPLASRAYKNAPLGADMVGA
jgi:hypothetical protein